MRLLLLFFMFLPISAHAQTQDTVTTLHQLASAVREAQKQSEQVENELRHLRTEQKQLHTTLLDRRFQATSAYHALLAMQRSPEKNIFLLPNSQYRDRFQAMRRTETVKDFLMHRIHMQTQVILDLHEKQASIEDYIRRRDMLALTINSALQQIKNLNQSKTKPQEFQILMNDIKKEAESLDAFLKTLLDLPANEKIADTPLVFSLPVSGIILPKDNGIEIKAASQALITTPARGQVAYAGEFKPLGNIVIINHGQGYISILKNLHEIYVEEGFIVQDNDPIGILSVENAKKSGNSTMLYYELRYNHTVINPIEKITGL